MGMVGVLTGLWSEKFDQLAAVTNFIVMPMTFLSGTFYLVDRLPDRCSGSASRFNPFFCLDRRLPLALTASSAKHEGVPLLVGVIITAVADPGARLRLLGSLPPGLAAEELIRVRRDGVRLPLRLAGGRSAPSRPRRPRAGDVRPSEVGRSDERKPSRI